MYGSKAEAMVLGGSSMELLGKACVQHRLRAMEVVVIKTPNPIDKHVGARVRMRRMLLGMSQEKLGDALGLTFQQVQKYEKGTNRIGASRLQQISKALNVTAAFFFEGVPLGDGVALPGFSEERSPGFVVDFLSTSEGMHLNKAFARIRDPKVRKRIVDLVTALAEEDIAPEPLAKAGSSPE